MPSWSCFSDFPLQVNMKMREITEREHKVKHHPLESPSHQKVKPSNSVPRFIFSRTGWAQVSRPEVLTQLQE